MKESTMNQETTLQADSSPLVRVNLTDLICTDWVLSSNREPPSGKVEYECKIGSREVRCERLESSDGPVWASDGFIVHGVSEWRITVR